MKTKAALFVLLGIILSFALAYFAYDTNAGAFSHTATLTVTNMTTPTLTFTSTATQTPTLTSTRTYGLTIKKH